MSRPTDLDLARLDALADALGALIEGDALTRQVVFEHAGRKHRATLTLGVFLDQLDRLAALGAGSAAAEARVDEAAAALSRARGAQPDAFRDTLAREIRSHVDAWRWYLEACPGDLARCADDYPSEVRNRIRLQQLFGAAEAAGIAVDEARGKVEALDRSLRDLFEDGDYIGPAGEAERFPMPSCWWLYGRPRAR